MKKEFIVLWDNGCGDPGNTFDTKQEAIESMTHLLKTVPIDSIWLYEGYFIGQPEENDDEEYVEGSLKKVAKKKGHEFILIHRNEDEEGWRSTRYANSFNDFATMEKDVERVIEELFAKDLYCYQAKFIGQPELSIR